MHLWVTIIQIRAYILDLGNLTCESSVVNHDCGSDNHGLAELLVGASHTSVVTLDLMIGGNDEVLALRQSDISVLFEFASSNLRAFGVKHDRALLVLSLLESLLKVLKSFQVRLQFKVRGVTLYDRVS